MVQLLLGCCLISVAATYKKCYNNSIYALLWHFFTSATTGLGFCIYYKSSYCLSAGDRNGAITFEMLLNICCSNL